MQALRIPRRCGLLLTLGMLAACAIATSVPADAQHARIIPLDHPAYEYIHRLQRRGHLLDLHPTALPYTFGEVARAVRRLDREAMGPASRRWFGRLRAAVGRRANREATVTGVGVQSGVRISSTTRLDPLRPTPDDRGTLRAASLNYFPHAAVRPYLARGPAVAQAGIRFDLYYRDDPDALDAANRLVSRNEDVYVGIGTRFVSAYFGRIGHHWAPPGETALLVSRNPVGIDQLHLRIGGNRLSLRSLVGELDSITGDDRYTGTAGADSVASSVRRYLSTHRFDWRPSRHVALTLMESTVYSGENAGFSLKFLNPLAVHVLAVDGRPKNDENNGLIAGMLWAQYRAWTLQGQLLVDDIDLMNVSGEPPAVALSGSLIYAGLGRADLGAAFTGVASRTYNAEQPEGRYTHLLRGIGAPYTDYVHASAFATFYFGSDDLDVALTPRLDALFQGAADIHMPYPASPDAAEFILDGIIQHVVRPALQVRVQRGRSLWMHVDVGPAIIENDQHRSTNDRTAWTVTAALTARFDLVDRLALSF